MALENNNPNSKTADRAADNIRALVVAMVEKAKSGHPGGAMGGADFINILYSEFLNYDPDDPAWVNRDRFYLDPGHMSPMLYAQLVLCGLLTIDDIKNFRQLGSVTSGHPEMDAVRMIDNTSGPLGQGHAMGLGAAIAERFLAARFGEWMAHKTYTFISDGGIQEEISQGVGRIAGHLGLSNFIMFFDSNDIQLSTNVSDVSSEDTEAKYKSWGWNVVNIDGNNQHEIRKALIAANAEKERPTLIIGKTIMAKGAIGKDGGSFERKISTHGQPMSNAGADVEATLKNLGADPADPFAIFSDVTDYYRDVLDKKREIARVKKAEQVEWEKQNPELAKKFASFMNNVLPVIDWEAIPQKPDAPTRTSSALILAEFASKIDNMIVSSADLANSDMTEGFLKASKPFKKGDFTGGFLHAGVAELTMAAVMNGIASHGGVIAACGTFFVFSDYMKPAMRMAALMELPVKYIWTHDTFRVGEDGPTHQPIEQEAQARLLEKIANLHGKRSMLVLRPADTAETKAAWKMAIENFNGPTALLLSRQVMTDIPVKSQSSTRFAEAIAGSNVGAYAVVDGGDNPDLILIANGAEVITCIDSAQALKKDHGLNVRVISAISEGLFKDQDKDYRESLIPFGKPVMAFTAGLPVNFAEMIGPFGKTIGLPRFGESAPFKVLEETFGYTVENVVKQALGCVEECKVMVERVKSLC